MALAVTHSATMLDKTIVEMTDVKNAEELLNTDLFGGAVSLFQVDIDNSIVTLAEKVWVKFYDDITTSFVGGTTPPIMILPVPKETTGDTVAVIGILSMSCPDGLEFENGMSVLCSLENGDTMTTAPHDDAPVDVRILGS